MFIRIEKCRMLGREELPLLSRFGASELSRLEKINNCVRRGESSSALVALARLTEGIDAKLDIVREDSSRPHFLFANGLDFNLTHSGALAAAVLSADGKVGIDIEKIEYTDIDKKERLAERYFTENEKKLLRESEEHTEAFYRIWTAKEALAKQKGEGLATALSCDTVNRADCLFISFILCCEGESYMLTVAYDRDDSLGGISAYDGIVVQTKEI